MMFNTDGDAWAILEQHGFKRRNFIIQLPSRELTELESEAVNYLCSEWDWGAEKAETHLYILIDEESEVKKLWLTNEEAKTQQMVIDQANANIDFDLVEPRGIIEHFSEMMEMRLQGFDDERGVHGWANESDIHMFDRLIETVYSLKQGLLTNDKEKVLKECADIANFAMMIFDIDS